uniref:Ras-related and estrogen-regulated growth inhibitor-like n=1 Tax=Diabrotica virgifera virgifera TaxID=50390 RepID=A0A6P7GCS2_DIAVI
VVVRYLTKRYIGEYSSNVDFLYKHNVTFDTLLTEVEIMDTSMCAVSMIYINIFIILILIWSPGI